MKLYLFGPMRGKPDWNFAAFDAARTRLEKLGHTVFCPASLFKALPYSKTDTQDRGHLLHVIQQDMACIYAAEGLAGLPGWENSTGSTVEVSLALFLRLPVFCAESLQELDIIPCPWYARYKDCRPYPKQGGRRLDEGLNYSACPPSVCQTCNGHSTVHRLSNPHDIYSRVDAIPCPTCVK